MPREPSSFAATNPDSLRQVLEKARASVVHWRNQRVRFRGLMLYVLVAPLAIAAFIALISGNLEQTTASVAALGLVILGARFNRRGFVESAIAPERHYTKVVQLPYQHLAMLLTAGGTLLAAYAVAGHGATMSVVYGTAAAVGFHLTYPLPSFTLPQLRAAKPVPDPTTRRALEQGEKRLLAIEKAALGVGNPELEQRLHQIAAKGRSVLDLLAERPSALFQARRFLNVHLDGAERVVSRFVKAHRLVRGGILESKFRNVLTQIESAFERQHRDLLANDLSELDVHIEVLRKQLQREGIA